jgi:hypothetical protein
LHRRELVRAQLEAGRLPDPRGHLRYYKRGDGSRCAGCTQCITDSEIQCCIELPHTSEPWGSLVMHARCFEEWHAEARTMSPGRSAKVVEARKGNGDIRRHYRDNVLDSVVAAVITATQATAGYIQILEPGTNHPAVRAHKGLRAQVREHLDRVDCRQAPYATALKTGRRVIRDRDANGRTSTAAPSVRCVLHSDAQTIQATPLMGESGEALGVLSTHYRDSNPLDARELSIIDQCAQRAVSIVEWHRRALSSLSL